MGIDPFGGPYPVDSTAEDISSRCDELSGTEVSIAGRITAFRQHGRATFADLRDRRAGFRYTRERTYSVKKSMPSL